MDYTNGIILIIAGVIAGFINTMAGGGSLLTLPILIFMGLPPSVANGTNRVSILFQSISSIAGFKSKGVSAFPFSLWVGISSAIGAIIGAQFSIQISGALFNQLLAIVMIAVVLVTIFNPIKNPEDVVEKLGKKSQLVSMLVFFFIGIYAGFIQAGVGFIILAALTLINNISLVKSNSIKMFVVLCCTVMAMAVFILEDQVDWKYGLTLAVGSSAGGWMGSRWSVGKGDVWVRWFMIVMVTLMAIKLWFDL